MIGNNVTGRPVPGTFAMFPRRASRDRGLGAGHLRVLQELCAHRNSNTGLAFPSTITLSRALGISRRAVQKSLKVLEERGYIKEVVDQSALDRRGRTWRIIY